MRNARAILTMRLVRDTCLLRVAGWLCSLFSLAYLGFAGRGLAARRATRGELYLGLAMAGIGGVLFVMLGLITLFYEKWSKKVAIRERWWEFASYVLCMGVMIGGILPLPMLALSHVQVIFGAMVVSDLAVSILLLGMLSSVLRAVTNEGHCS